MIAKGGIMISINICKAEAVRRKGTHVILMEYNTLRFPLLNCQEKLSESSVIRTTEKSGTGERVKVTAQDRSLLLIKFNY